MIMLCSVCNLYFTKFLFLHRFAQKINLTKHVQTHVAGNVFPCPHCNINFRTREDIARHILKQHPGAAVATVSTRFAAPSPAKGQRERQSFTDRDNQAESG